MDWIERLFHLSPDGGNGALELGIATGALVALAMILVAAIKLVPTVRSWSHSLAKRSASGSNRPESF
jgi:hypothetical protein